MLLDPQAVKEVFLATIDKPTHAERIAYLDEACRDNAELRQRVEVLLKEHELSGSFPHFLAMNGLGDADGTHSVIPTPDGVTETRSEAARPSDSRAILDFLEPPREPGHLGRLGHYEIHSIIGQGGMGVVLKAFDEG